MNEEEKKRERRGGERGEKEREKERERERGGREGIKEEGEEEGIERYGSDNNLLWMNQFNLKYKILWYGEELRWVTISLQDQRQNIKHSRLVIGRRPTQTSTHLLKMGVVKLLTSFN